MELASRAICAAVVEACRDSIGGVALFAALPGEPELRGAAEELMRLGVRVCLPRCLPGNRLRFARVTSWDELRPGRFAALEPGEGAPAAEPAELGSAVLPGVAFDLAGYRLGRGGGFYDRAFGSAAGRPRLLGVAFDWQLVEALPHEEHDVPMALVITECRRLLPERAERPGR